VKGSLYTLAYAAVLGTVCALLLTAASIATAPYREANAKAEEISNILTVLKIPFEDSTSSEKLLEIFKNNVREEVLAEETLYIYSSAQGQVEAIAVRFSGRGLWGPIKGFLALESDRRTIRGVTFYEQEETPGLGGEIVSSWFRQQFIGKSIIDKTGSPGIIIQSISGETSRNQVHAITGATMTCEKVQAMLNKVITKIVEEQN